MLSVNSMSILKDWGHRAVAVIVRPKALAPNAMIELVLPGGSVMALLLWLYRRRKNGVGFRRFPGRLLSFLRLADPIFTDHWRKIGRILVVLRSPADSARNSESVQGAELVPVKVAKIGEIKLTRAAFAHARRVFTRGAASS
jgi:hypothetical protein